MTRKRRGFLLFCFSLIPGAGEMYMGFFKQGISLMSIFWAIIVGATWLNLGPVMFILPVLWFYSFFRVHNLAAMSDEEFYAVEDEYLFHLSDIDTKKMFAGDKGRKITAIVLILIGVCAVWDIISDMIWDFMDLMGINTSYYYSFIHQIPQFAFAVFIIWVGVYLIKGKKQQLDAIEEQSVMREAETGEKQDEVHSEENKEGVE